MSPLTIHNNFSSASNILICVHHNKLCYVMPVFLYLIIYIYSLDRPQLLFTMMSCCNALFFLIISNIVIYGFILQQILNKCNRMNEWMNEYWESERANEQTKERNQKHNLKWKWNFCFCDVFCLRNKNCCCFSLSNIIFLFAKKFTNLNLTPFHAFGRNMLIHRRNWWGWKLATLYNLYHLLLMILMLVLLCSSHTMITTVSQSVLSNIS